MDILARHEAEYIVETEGLGVIHVPGSFGIYVGDGMEEDEAVVYVMTMQSVDNPLIEDARFHIVK